MTSAELMVSDFIEERDGFLARSDKMYATLSKEDTSLKQAARVIFEHGKAKEGYWDNGLFMEQMEVAVQVAVAKYPPRIYKQCSDPKRRGKTTKKWREMQKHTVAEKVAEQKYRIIKDFL